MSDPKEPLRKMLGVQEEYLQQQNEAALNELSRTRDLLDAMRKQRNAAMEREAELMAALTAATRENDNLRRALAKAAKIEASKPADEPAANS